jgi:hypothetical protein
MTPNERRGERAHWPVRIYRLGEEPSDDLSATTTAEARIEMVDLLSRRMREIVEGAHGAGVASSAPASRVVREGGIPGDPSELLTMLLESGARFLVIGAHAMAVHGVPRATQDLDLWIDPDPANAARVWRSLLVFGAPLGDLKVTVEDLSAPDRVVQIGLPPNRVDLLTSMSGIERFDAAWADRVEHYVGGRLVPFIGRMTLVLTKRASGRRKDLADLEALGELPS